MISERKVLRWCVLLAIAGFVPISVIDLERFLGDGGRAQYLLKSGYFAIIAGLYLIRSILAQRISVYKLPLSYGALTVVASASLFWTISLAETIKALVELSAVCVLFWLYRECRITRREVMLAIAWGCLFVVVVSMLVYLRSPQSATDFSDQRYRLAGITYGSHALARAAVVGVAALLFAARHVRTWPSVLGLALLPLIVYCVNLTFSRQALLFIGVLLILFTGRHLGKRASVFISVLFGSLFVALLFQDGAVQMLVEAIARNNVSDVFTLSGRTYIWDFAWQEFLQRPLLGVGFGAGDLLVSEAYTTASGWTTTSAHNAVLHAMLELGAIGMVLYCGIYAQCLINGWRLVSVDLFSAFFAVFLFSIGLIEQGLAGGADYFFLMWLIFLGRSDANEQNRIAHV